MSVQIRCKRSLNQKTDILEDLKVLKRSPDLLDNVKIVSVNLGLL